VTISRKSATQMLVPSTGWHEESTRLRHRHSAPRPPILGEALLSKAGLGPGVPPNLGGLGGLPMCPAQPGFLFTPFCTRALLTPLLVFAIAFLAGCTTPSTAPQESLVGNFLDVGFDYLLAPNVFDLEDGTRIHPLQLGPSIAYLIESESGLVLVDAGVPELDKIILAYLKHIGRDDLKLIYITHAHLDHYGSAEALRTATGAQITVQVADAGVMAAGETRLGTVRDWETVSDFALPTIEEWLAVLEPTPPDFAVEDGDRLDEFGIDAYVIHTPGHTPGSSVLMLNDRYAFVGDLVSNTGSPHAQSSYAYDWDQLADSLARVQSLNPELVFAGHGTEPITGAEFQELTPAFEEE